MGSPAETRSQKRAGVSLRVFTGLAFDDGEA